MSKEFSNQPQPNKRPEQTQPLQGRAVGRESLQGPTTVDGSAHGRSEITSVQEHLDGHEPDAIARHGNKGKTHPPHSPEHRAKISEAVRRSWQSRSPLTPEERAEKKRKYMRDYQKNNKDKVNAYQRRYRSGDPSIATNQKLIEHQWRLREQEANEQEANDPSTDFAQIEQQLREALQSLQIFPSPRQKK
jgi:hypothetical protein